MTTLKRGQISYEGGCSTFFAWVFCKLMRMFGKEEHLFHICGILYLIFLNLFFAITLYMKTILLIIKEVSYGI